MENNWHLAQINVGTVRYPTDDPRMQGFMQKLDEINALAEASPGFVWRLQGNSGNATDIDVGGDALFLVNMSVWQDTQSLFEYVYKTAHRDIMVQRRQFFEKPAGLYQVLWWVPAGHLPTPEEGLQRLAQLEAQGPTPFAFTFQQPFPAPDSGEEAESMNPGDHCSGWE